MQVVQPPNPPIITVFRKITGPHTRYWYFSGGRPFEMSERLAIKDAARGRVKIKTVDHG